MVNQVGLFLLAVVCSSVFANKVSLDPDVKERNTLIENTIRAGLESLRTNNAIYPSIALSPIDTTIQAGFTDLRLTFNHAEVIGIPTFTIEDLIFDALTPGPLVITGILSISLSFPEVIVTGSHYSFKGILAGVLPIDGEGPFVMKLSKANLMGDGNVKITVASAKVEVTNLAAGILFDTFYFEFVNIFGSLTDDFNKMMTEIGKDVLTEMKPQLDGILSRYLENLINRVLGKGATEALADEDLGQIFSDALVEILKRTVDALENQHLPEYI